MDPGFESLEGRTAHALRWRVRGLELGVEALELHELSQELIEFVVGDLRSILDVIESLVSAYLLSELLDLLSIAHGFSGEPKSESDWMRGSPQLALHVGDRLRGFHQP
jgi:hypothetical protein